MSVNIANWWLYHIDISSALTCDFQSLTMIFDDLRVISDISMKLSQEKNIVEEIE